MSDGQWNHRVHAYFLQIKQLTKRTYFIAVNSSIIPSLDTPVWQEI